MAVGYSVYVEKKSVIHDILDPRTKMFCLLCLFALSLCFNHPVPIVLMLVFVLGVGIYAKLSAKQMAPYLVASLWFLILGICIWPFYITQGKPLFKLLGTQVTVDGLMFGFAMGIRIATMVTTAGVAMMTISPQKMMTGLMKIGLPSKAGMAVSSTIRFVPLINGERMIISEAQRARGLNLDKGSAFSKAIKSVRIIGPLLLRTFGLTQSLAIAMDCRAFGARSNRTSIFEIKLSKLDKIIMAIGVIAVIVGVICRIMGIGVLIKSYL